MVLGEVIEWLVFTTECYVKEKIFHLGSRFHEKTWSPKLVLFAGHNQMNETLPGKRN